MDLLIPFVEIHVRRFYVNFLMLFLHSWSWRKFFHRISGLT